MDTHPASALDPEALAMLHSTWYPGHSTENKTQIHQAAVAQGLPVTRMAPGIAAWMQYLKGVDELEQSYTIDDPQAEALKAVHQRSSGQGANTEAVQAMLSYVPVFGDLVENRVLAAELLGALKSLQTRGVLATRNEVKLSELSQ